MSPFEIATLLLAAVVGIGSAAVTTWIQGRQADKQRTFEAIQRATDENEKRRTALIQYERVLRDEANRELTWNETMLLSERPTKAVQQAMEAAYPYFFNLRTTEARGQYWQLFQPGRGVTDVLEYKDSFEEAADVAHTLIERFDREESRPRRGLSAD